MKTDKSTQQRRRELLGEIATLGHMLRGTLVHTLRAAAARNTVA